MRSIGPHNACKPNVVASVGKNQNIYQLIVGKVPPCIIYIYTDDDVDVETFIFMHGSTCTTLVVSWLGCSSLDMSERGLWRLNIEGSLPLSEGAVILKWAKIMSQPMLSGSSNWNGLVRTLSLLLMTIVTPQSALSCDVRDKSFEVKSYQDFSTGMNKIVGAELNQI